MLTLSLIILVRFLNWIGYYLFSSLWNHCYQYQIQYMVYNAWTICNGWSVGRPTKRNARSMVRSMSHLSIFLRQGQFTLHKSNC